MPNYPLGRPWFDSLPPWPIAAVVRCGHPRCGERVCRAGLEYSIVPKRERAWSIACPQGYTRRPDGVCALSRHAARSDRRAPRRPSVRAFIGGEPGERLVEGALIRSVRPDGTTTKVYGRARPERDWLSVPVGIGNLSSSSAPLTIACALHGHRSVVIWALLEKALAKVCKWQARSGRRTS